MRLILFLFFLLFSCPYFFGAQEDSLAQNRETVLYDSASALHKVSFENEDLAKFKEDKAFDYLSQIENDSWWTKFKRWLSLKYQQLLDWIFGEYTAHSLVVAFLSILPYIIVAIIIGLIVWLFIRLNPGPSLIGNPESGSVFFNEEEKIVRSRNISALIDAAIKAGDYRLAIRYYYLQLLKHLNEKGLINYEFQKTNSEYLSEISDESYKPKVKKLMRLYDFIWYGSFNVTEKDFALAQNSFRETENAILKLPDEK